MTRKCRKCEYYFVTWDKDRPSGCKAYDFKSKKLPCLVVKDESGIECTLFKEKQLKKSNKVDLNDSKYW